MEGLVCAKAQRCETGGAPGEGAGRSFNWKKGTGRPMEGILGSNAGLQMA